MNNLKAAYRAVGILVVLSLVTSAAGPVLAAPSPRPSAQSAGVDPPSLSFSVNRGERAVAKVTVTTASAPIPKVDVLFLFDVTNSMVDVIDTAKEKGLDILKAIQSKVADTTFGLASVADYPGHFDSAGYAEDYGAPTDYPWRLDVPLTQEATTVVSGIQQLKTLDGMDGPEAYSRALFESTLIDWRPDAKHILVFFGDSVAHDPEFYLPYGRNTGIDPGEDGETDTPDDLTFEYAVSMVRDRGLEVIPVNSDTGHNDCVKASFEYMAEQTSGAVYQLDDVSGLADTVVAGLTQAMANISSLTLKPDAGFETWVQLSPASFADVAGGQVRQFEVTFSVPKDARFGRHTFQLTAYGDRAFLGATTVNLTVGGLTLDAVALKSEKLELIQQLSAPEFDTTVFGAPFKWMPDALVSYAIDEWSVKTWVDSLDWSHLSTAELGAVAQLTLQERALKRLMQAQATTLHVGNSQAAHAVGLIVSIVSIGDFVTNVLPLTGEKTITGRLVTKLKNYAYSKAIGFATTLVLWATEGMEDDPGLSGLRAGFRLVMEALEEDVKDALKKDAVSGKDWLRIILLNTMVTMADQLFCKTYLTLTRSAIGRGLDGAKSHAARSIALEGVQTELGNAMDQVEGPVSAMESQARALDDEKEELEKKQEVLSMVADIAEGVATLMTATGLGAAYAWIGHAISLGIKLADLIVSGDLARRAYAAWGQTPGTADQVTGFTFAYGAAPRVAQRAGSGQPLAALALASRPGHDGASAGGLSAHTTAQLSRLDADASSYLQLLEQLARAVAAGDVKQAEPIVDQLLSADETLGESFLSARQPILAGAQTALGKDAAGFGPVYKSFAQGAVDFDGQGASMYFYLLSWLSEPTAESQQRLLQQVKSVEDSTQAYQAALVAARPYVEGVAAQPSALVARYTLPELHVGQRATLEVEIANPAPSVAKEVVVTLDPGQNARAAKTVFRLAELAGGGTAPLGIDFVPQAENGWLSLSTTVTGGNGSYRLVRFTATPPSARLPAGTRGVNPTQGGANDAGVLPGALLLLVAVAGSSMVAWRFFSDRAIPRGARLVILTGSRPGRQVVGLSRHLTIGRDRRNSLVLLDARVSGRHATITPTRTGYLLADLGSANGTLVNGHPITRQWLRPGDEIQIGSTVMRFYV